MFLLERRYLTKEFFIDLYTLFRKFNAHLFWGVAITTQMKADPYYFPVDFKGYTRCVMLSHLRLYDTKRLLGHKSKMGKLSPKQFGAVKRALKELL